MLLSFPEALPGLWLFATAASPDEVSSQNLWRLAFSVGRVAFAVGRVAFSDGRGVSYIQMKPNTDGLTHH